MKIIKEITSKLTDKAIRNATETFETWVKKDFKALYRLTERAWRSNNKIKALDDIFLISAFEIEKIEFLTNVIIDVFVNFDVETIGKTKCVVRFLSSKAAYQPAETVMVKGKVVDCKYMFNPLSIRRLK